MNRVWTVTPYGNINREKFEDVAEAFNYLKRQTLGNNKGVVETLNKKVFFFENGEQCSAARAKLLAKEMQDILTSSIDRELGDVRKKKR